MADEVRKVTGTVKSFDGTPIYFESRGQGPPILMAYGLACPMNHWTHQLKYFSRDYQTIVFDYRGHHRTPTPKNLENLSIDAICHDLKAVCEHLEVKKASFWGHSYGVPILIRSYDLYPDLFHSLVFVNGFATNPIKNMFGVDIVAHAFRFFKDGYEAFPETLNFVWRAAVKNPLAIPLSALAGGFNLKLASLKDIEVYAQGVAQMDLNVFITLFDQMMNYDGSPVLDRISVPTLIISGNKDGVTPLSYQLSMHERIKGSEFTLVPYGSHCTQLDLPEFVNLRAEKFLRAIEYAGTLKARKPRGRRRNPGH